MDKKPAIQKSDAEWAKELDPLQHHVLRQHGTERPAAARSITRSAPARSCALAAASRCSISKTKYESGSGWLSFYALIGRRRRHDRQDRHGPHRGACAKCGHLGHVFPTARSRPASATA